MRPSGFFVDKRQWADVDPRNKGFYAENPPEDWEDCKQCDFLHPAKYTGDCRSDINSWPSEECVRALEKSSNR